MLDISLLVIFLLLLPVVASANVGLAAMLYVGVSYLVVAATLVLWSETYVAKKMLNISGPQPYTYRRVFYRILAVNAFSFAVGLILIPLIRQNISYIFWTTSEVLHVVIIFLMMYALSVITEFPIIYWAFRAHPKRRAIDSLKISVKINAVSYPLLLLAMPISYVIVLFFVAVSGALF